MNEVAANIDLNEVTHADADEDQYLTFIMAGEEYGVDILRVQEIRGWDSVTPLPNTPAYIRGVINIRGTIVPIVDLRERFNIDAIDYGVTTVVIVLRILEGSRERVMGIIVDAVSDVYNVSREEMKAAPDFGTVVDVAFVKGLVTVNEKMIIVLNIDELMTSATLAALDSVV